MFFSKREPSEQEIKRDLNDRLAVKYLFTLTLVTGEEVDFESRYIRIGRYTRGVESYIEFELLGDPITIGNYTYNNKAIVKVERKVLSKRYIKKEIKKEMNGDSTFGDWHHVLYAKEEHLEEEEA